MNCPACVEKRLHSEAEWENHPLARHGAFDGKWTCEEARQAHDDDARRLQEGRKA